MTNEPFFSVVIPLFNKEDYIANTIKSVLNQRYQNFEVIIVNDGSIDNSVEIVKRFSNSRITIINQKNQGLSVARNSGIKHSNYDYIAFLDADDLWFKDYLLTIYNLIRFNSKSEVFATSFRLLRPKQKANLLASDFDAKKAQIITNYFRLSKNIFCNSSLVVKKSVFSRIGNFNDQINYGEEEDFFIRCFSLYNLTYYKIPKVFYLKGIKNQLTSPNSNIDRIIPDYSIYLNNKNQRLLKPYVDFIYFKLVVLYKMERNYDLVKFYKQKISPKNLTLIQKIKFHLPTSLFYYTKTFYLWLSKRLIHS